MHGQFTGLLVAGQFKGASGDGGAGGAFGDGGRVGGDGGKFWKLLWGMLKVVATPASSILKLSLPYTPTCVRVMEETLAGRAVKFIPGFV